jgi:hypothetical protein
VLFLKSENLSMKAISLLCLIFLGCSTPTPLEVVDRIDGPMDKRHEKFRQCYVESDSYQRALAENEDRSITVSFTLLPDGKVAKEKILRSDFKDANLHHCILWLTRETKFSQAPDATEVEVFHPINFRSREL